MSEKQEPKTEEKQGPEKPEPGQENGNPAQGEGGEQPAGAEVVLTLEAIKRMSQDEINKNWEAVSAVLEKGIEQ